MIKAFNGCEAGELLELFKNFESSRLAIVIELGNRFLDVGGGDFQIEKFLRSLLVGKNRPDETSKSGFAFLEACRGGGCLKPVTLKLLDCKKGEPPYSDFFQPGPCMDEIARLKKVSEDFHRQDRSEKVASA